jgi:branched-chain amino acid transport system ATP-binding protein
MSERETPPLLEIRGLTARFGGLVAINELDLHIQAGEIFALVGPNGAGKTTVLNCISGLVRPAAGSIRFAGRELLGLALVPEGRDLFGSLTVRENLLMGAYTRRVRAEIERDIERILGLFPRLKTRLHAPAASLSGGEGQMLAIGRALMSHPRLLLLDEPSQGLAPVIVETVFEVIVQLNRDERLTIVLVEQNAHQALDIAHDAYILQGGSIVLNGVTTALARGQEVRALYMGG